MVELQKNLELGSNVNNLIDYIINVLKNIETVSAKRESNRDFF